MISYEIERPAYDEFLGALCNLENVLPRKLADGGVEIENYARKLYQYANIFCCRNERRKIIALAAFYSNDQKTYIAFLSFIAVDVLYQRKKIGEKLLQICEKYALQVGMKSIRLEVLKENQKAQKFYRYLGYSEFETLKESLIMTKDL